MVEVGGQASGRGVQKLVVVWDVLSQGGDDDGDVGDGVLAGARLQSHLQGVLVQQLQLLLGFSLALILSLMLLSPPRQASNDKVVCDPAVLPATPNISLLHD